MEALGSARNRRRPAFISVRDPPCRLTLHRVSSDPRRTALPLPLPLTRSLCSAQAGRQPAQPASKRDSLADTFHFTSRVTSRPTGSLSPMVELWFSFSSFFFLFVKCCENLLSLPDCIFVGLSLLAMSGDKQVCFCSKEER